SRAHAFEDMLKELRERPELSGDDFLPLVVRLDDLFAHLKSLRELMQQLNGLRAVAGTSQRMTAGQRDATRMTPVLTQLSPSQPLSAGPGLQIASGLETLAQRVAVDHGRRVKLVTQGFEDVPPQYLRAVRGIAIQFVRNGVVHGVEDAQTRASLGKPEIG